MDTAVRGTPTGNDPAGALDPARHEAVLFTAPADLAAGLAPRVRTAVEAGHVVVAVLDAPCEDALRAALGPHGDAVEFADPRQVHSVPPFTVAIRYARTSRRVARSDGRAMVVGQCVEDLPGCEPEHWARLDIALNVAIAGLPITVLCPYRAAGPGLPRARTTHPVISGPAGPAPSPEFRPPRDAVIDHPPPPPPDLGSPDAELAFTAAELATLRRLVARVAGTAGLGRDRVADVVLAVNELASNSVEHGPGSGVLRMWTGAAHGAAFVAEVTDVGVMVDVPFPGLVLPPTDGARGRGLWLASELCDVLQVWSGGGATVIRVHQDR